MKRRLESDGEAKSEVAGASPPTAGMGEEMKHMVAALVAKELLATLTCNPGGAGASRFGNVPFGAEQETTVNAFLHQKLGNDSLMRRPGPGGKRLTYIESCKAIELANRAFGFNGWSCHIIDCSQEYREKRGDRWTIGFSSVVRIELKDGTSHEDVGFGTSDGQRDLGAAIEQAKKASISDARKRALRLFGEYLGNSCYDREHIKEVTAARAPPPAVPLPPPSGLPLAPAAVISGQQQQQHQQHQQQQKQQQPNPSAQPQGSFVQQPHQQQQPQSSSTLISRGSTYAPASHGVSTNTPAMPASMSSSTPMNTAAGTTRISVMHQQQQQQQQHQQQFKQQPQQPQQSHQQSRQLTNGMSSGGSTAPRAVSSSVMSASSNGVASRNGTHSRPEAQTRSSGAIITNSAPPARQPPQFQPNSAPPPTPMMRNVEGESPFKMEELIRRRNAAAAAVRLPALAPAAASPGFSVDDLSYSQFDFDPNTSENDVSAKRMRT